MPTASTGLRIESRPGDDPAGPPDRVSEDSPPRWAMFLILAGLFLTLRGYHSFDGDQAYRLPLLVDRQDPAVYATDPFVRAFDAFNPHRGYLALIDAASRPLGLAAGLAGLFALTLGATILGVDRLARAAWPEIGPRVGLIAVALVLAAKAGNVGTNHLFEATLLDRLVGFALGWLALASAVGDPARGARGAAWIGLAALVHPSVGLQVGLTMAAAWLAWAMVPGRSGVRWTGAAAAIGALGLALAPGMAAMAGQGGRLFEGMPADEFRLLSVMVQGPQHMLPSTWRASQWLAWGCYPALALLALGGPARDGARQPARARLAILMAVNLASLALAYLAVEVMGNLRVTVFQPFRMATLTRGLALVAISGRVAALWGRGDLAGRARAALIAAGLSGDRALVVATAVDLGMAVAGWASRKFGVGRGVASPDQALSNHPTRRWLPIVPSVGLGILAYGLAFLARHDTESGHVPMLGALGALAGYTLLSRWRRPSWTPRRIGLALAASWAVPAVALAVPIAMGDPGRGGWAAAMVGRCRFAEVPADDLERLAAWCRDRTPPTARFVGPPGPKTFRLWSRRPLAFNRSSSPYHARGLADWAARYRDHVGFDGPTAEFARAYLADRHDLEARYQAMSDAGRAALARRQGATHVLAAAPPDPAHLDPAGPLELLRIEGRYAAYRVRPDRPRTASAPGSRDRGRGPIDNSAENFDGIPFQSAWDD